MKAVWYSALTAIFLIWPSHDLLGQEQQKIKASDAVKISTRLGGSVAKTYMNHENIEVPPSGLTPEERSTEIEAALGKYQRTKNFYGGASSGSKVVKGIVGAGFAVGTIYTGGALPVVLLGAGSAAGLELTDMWVEDRGKESAGKVLAALSKDLMEETNAGSIEEFLADPEKIGEAIRTNDKFLKDVKARAKATNDPKLLDAAVTAVEAFGANVDAVQLGALIETVGSVQEIETNFTNFMSETRASARRIEERLKLHLGLIETIQDDVTVLKDQVNVLDQKIDVLGANQDLIADFMFSGLSSSEKADALRSGLMDRRIICPKDVPNCDPKEIKAAMIERYESDARLQSNVELAGDILKGINDVSAIASNLNIPIGEDGAKALEVAGAAVNAYIGFASGDYFGAIASITGVFGNKPDPDAERFKIMMNYLREQFEIVNSQLKNIQENQQKIYDGILSLSEQLETVYFELDGRLTRMEFEQRRISDNVKQIIWAPWKACFSVYSYSIQNSYVDPKTLQFPNFDAVRKVADARAPQARSCMNTVTVALDGLNSLSGFKNFLDISISLDPASVAADGSLTEAQKQEANKWKDFESVYRNGVAVPTSSIVGDWSTRNSLTKLKLFYLLASDVYSVSDLEDLQFQVGEGELPVDCQTEILGFENIRKLVCLPGESEEALSDRHINAVLSTDVLLDVIDWMLVVAQLGNIYDKDPETFAENFSAIASLPDYNAGEEIVYRMIDATTLALASQYRIYGSIPALAVAEDLVNDGADQRHVLALRNNPYLAENTATLILHMKRGTWDLESGINGPKFENRYAQALIYARGDNSNRFEPLYALFDRAHEFVLDEDGMPSLHLEVDGEVANLRLPTPSQLSEGRFVFPPRVYGLRAKKDNLVERRLDYEFGSNEKLVLTILEN